MVGKTYNAAYYYGRIIKSERPMFNSSNVMSRAVKLTHYLSINKLIVIKEINAIRKVNAQT